MDIVDRLNNTELLPEEAFYSKLQQKVFSDKDYNQAINCWKEKKAKQ